MGFFDKVKNAFGSKKEDVESQNNLNDETTFNESIENDNGTFNEEIQSEDSEKTPANEEITDKPTPYDKIRNFKYLDDLIHSGAKEIVLDSNVVLGDDEELEYNEGIELDVDNLVIDGNGYSMDAQGKTRIFYCMGKNITLKNIILKNGYAEYGGAIYNKKSNITITESILQENTAQSGGGAIYNKDSTIRITKSSLQENITKFDGGAIDNNKSELTITESTLQKNTAKNEGGAIYNNRGEITITESTLQENTAQREYGGGGAINNYDGNLTIASSTLTGNTSDGKYGGGGAIDNNHGNLTITNSTLTENTSEGEYGEGGAIKNNKGKLTITRSTLTGNTSKQDGGAIEIYSSRFIISKSTFDNNTAEGNGGAIKINNWRNNESSISESRFTSNTAVSGGAIYKEEGDLNITDSTFSENMAARDGGAISNFKGALTIANSTLHDNTVNGDGGAIVTDSCKNITDCLFNNNSPKDICELKDFYYLDNLIHSGAKEVVLDSDIILHDSEEGDETINLDVNDIVIDGNGHTIDAKGKKQIFHCNGKNITLKNIKFKNGYTKYEGGAIEINKGQLSIFKSAFIGNVADDGAAIYNTAGNINFFNCEFISNRSERNIISNKMGNILNANLEFQYAKFINNQAKHIISNRDNKSKLVIIEGEFKENNVEESVLCNKGKSCTLDKTIFENNLSNADNIFNQGNLTLISPKVVDEGKTIQNTGHILIKGSSTDFENKIYGEGIVESSPIPVEQKFNFTYLDNEIHECKAKEIVLEEDIRLENFELDFYEGGIELDIDDLVIDGNGHTIDGNNKSRIFIITGNNITIKNITFKNGHSYENYNAPFNNHGGAIKINFNRNISINNCEFINNASEDEGGAIYNRGGELTIKHSTLDRNMAEEGEGGAIYNDNGSSTISRSTLKCNTALIGGAIYNTGSLNILESALNENITRSLGGGGAIYNLRGDVTIEHSTLDKNMAEEGEGGAINNFEGILTIKKSNLNENTAIGTKGEGGGINNYDKLIIVESTLNNNTAKRAGGAIYNNYDCELTITDCKIENNTPDDVKEN